MSNEFPPPASGPVDPSSGPALPPPAPGPAMPPPAYYPPSQTPPPPPAYQPAPSSGKAIAVLVLGIASLVLMCAYGIGLIPAIIALAMAPGARREVKALNAQANGEGMIKAGVICSWVTVGITVAGLVLFLGLVLISAVSGSM